MTEATQTREPEMGLTFEKVWAMFQESDRRMQELNKETDRKIQEVVQHVREMNRETNQQIGRLGNRFGELAEHLVAPNIAEKFNALGYHFNDISTGLRKIILDESGGQKIAEFDILLENGESVIGVEVKARPSEQDVENHLRRLEILRRHKDSIGDRRKIHGALAGAIMLDLVKTAALKAGLYVITQTGDTVKIDVPEGFVPKAWQAER
jgi:hypothetical protein